MAWWMLACLVGCRHVVAWRLLAWHGSEDVGMARRLSAWRGSEDVRVGMARRLLA